MEYLVNIRGISGEVITMRTIEYIIKYRSGNKKKGLVSTNRDLMTIIKLFEAGEFGIVEVTFKHAKKKR
jgi:hypothetical protein